MKRTHAVILAALAAAAGLASCVRAPRVPQPALSPRAFALRFAKLVDGDGTITPDATIIVDGDRIASVGTGDRAVPRGVPVVDMRAYTAIPGMIDVHTHMTYWWDHAPGTKPFGPGGTRRTPAEVATVAMENASLTLETGVTTVRDLGASGYADILMRDRINRGESIGPRMFVAGYGLSKVVPRPNPASALPASGSAASALPASGPPGWLRGRITSISEIARAVQAQADSGADVIKMYGSTGTGADTSGVQTFTYEEMKAAVDAAHALGKRIAIHSYGPNGGRDAVRAGTNTLEHSTDLGDATLAQMARQGTIYVPTIDHNRYYADFRADYGYTDAQARGLDAYRARNTETARRAIKAGVKVAMGSDAVHMMFGQNTRELGLLVQAGMTPLQALRAATITGAEVLGMEDRIGRVKAGYYADIVAVEGDPERDVNATIYGVRSVWKGGATVFSLDGPARPQVPIAITHVDVIDGTSPSPRTDQTVIVTGNRITTVAPSASAAIPMNARSVDGRGKYLVPGFWDMHVHTDVPGGQDMLALFVANGVTGVRDMGGDFRTLQKWRAMIAMGALVGPRMIVSGPYLEGGDANIAHIDVRTPEQARLAVDSLVRLGVDFVKIHTQLKRDVYFAAARESRARGIPFAGHLPGDVTAAEASDSGQKSLDHLLRIPNPCTAAESEALKPKYPIQRVLGLCTADTLASLYARFVKNGTWIVPTFSAQLEVALWPKRELPGDAYASYLPDTLRKFVASIFPMEPGIPPDADITGRALFEKRLAVVGAMHRAGVGILAGTDYPLRNSPPGFGLHGEFDFLARAGLSPFNILRAATIDPARYFGMLDSMGTVAAGKVADLVLLDANPLTDIRNARKISAVVANGRLLDAASRQALLNAAIASGRSARR